VGGLVFTSKALLRKAFGLTAFAGLCLLMPGSQKDLLTSKRSRNGMFCSVAGCSEGSASSWPLAPHSCQCKLHARTVRPAMGQLISGRRGPGCRWEMNVKKASGMSRQAINGCAAAGSRPAATTHHTEPCGVCKERQPGRQSN
jgi:hypothetical protein